MRDKDKKLYKVSNRLGTFFIVATSFDEAANELRRRLDESDYGFDNYRKITSIELVATQSFFNNKQSFREDEGNLIIIENTESDGNVQ